MNPDDDAVRDGLALIEAAHNGDLEAVRVLLDHGDLRPVSVFLATVCADLLGDLADWWKRPEAELFGRLRFHHAGAPPTRDW